MAALEDLLDVFDAPSRDVDEGLRVWIALHAPDGDLRALWDGCERAATLLNLARDYEDPWPAVAAACAVARTVEALLPAQEPSFALALIEAEGWVRVRASWRFTQDAECTWQARQAVERLHAAGAPAVTILAGKACFLAAASADLATYYDAYTTANDAAEAAIAARCAAGEDASFVALQVAAVVRRHLGCPNLDRLNTMFQLE